METSANKKRTRISLDGETDTKHVPSNKAGGKGKGGVYDGDWDELGSDLVKGLDPRRSAGRWVGRAMVNATDTNAYAYDVDEHSRDSVLAGVVVHVVTGNPTRPHRDENHTVMPRPTGTNSPGTHREVGTNKTTGTTVHATDTTARWYDLAERMGAKCVYDYAPPRDPDPNGAPAARSSSINRSAAAANEITGKIDPGATKPTHILALDNTGACVREAVRIGKEALALVVQGEWLSACYEQRTRLDVSRYLLACNGQLTRSVGFGSGRRVTASIHNPRPRNNVSANTKTTSGEVVAGANNGSAKDSLQGISHMDRSIIESSKGSFKGPSNGSFKASSSANTTAVNSRAHSPTSHETATDDGASTVDVTLSQKIGEMFKRLPTYKKRKTSSSRKIPPPHTTTRSTHDTETSGSVQLVRASSTGVTPYTPDAEDSPLGHSELGDSGDVVYDDIAGREKMNRLKDDRRKANARFHLSAFSTDEKNKLINILEPLGIKVIQGEIYEPSCTHLVVKTPSGSEKFLAACAAGIWVLRMGYIIQCFQQQRMVDELPFIWSEQNRTKNSLSDEQWNLAKSYAHWRVAIQKQRDNGLPVGAFVGWKVLLRTNKDSVLRRMMAAGGGEVIEGTPPYTDDCLKRARYLFVDEKYDTDMNVSRYQQCGVECLRPEYMFHYLLEAPNLPLLDNYRVKTRDRSADSSPRDSSSHPRNNKSRTHTRATHDERHAGSNSKGEISDRESAGNEWDGGDGSGERHSAELIQVDTRSAHGTRGVPDSSPGIGEPRPDGKRGDGSGRQRAAVEGVDATHSAAAADDVIGTRRGKRNQRPSENGAGVPKRPKMRGV
ncbi:hypothetical protein, variant [Sphaeroforma arctica JP610]|uniref:BRCT domain-containing protein n=1 Tax=Sphaeroforma arctica JP610 TaxID=667725 RepID=A0A0L0FRA9_9EUKA|nr:hypothetical protein, variant [Sphaeroforma arctica JP610]KNC79224.1 hypothetical protein, variant [Sphaeroforma arctica JP610]|eukprot:XP_014153126.1 hypothetical protein, variant [Sphaeroforma arctica JP610]